MIDELVMKVLEGTAFVIGFLGNDLYYILGSVLAGCMVYMAWKINRREKAMKHMLLFFACLIASVHCMAKEDERWAGFMNYQQPAYQPRFQKFEQKQDFTYQKPMQIRLFGNMFLNFTIKPQTNNRNTHFKIEISFKNLNLEKQQTFVKAMSPAEKSLGQVQRLKDAYDAGKRARLVEEAPADFRQHLPTLPDQLRSQFDPDVPVYHLDLNKGQKVYRTPTHPDAESANSPGRIVSPHMSDITKVYDNQARHMLEGRVIRVYEVQAPVTVYQGKVKGFDAEQFLIPKNVDIHRALKWIDTLSYPQRTR